MRASLLSLLSQKMIQLFSAQSIMVFNSNDRRCENRFRSSFGLNKDLNTENM